MGVVLVRLLPRRRPCDERGAVALTVALLALVLFVMCAFVVDLGHARDRKQASQANSDAAALAGANVLYLTGGASGCTISPCFPQAVAAVEAYTARNFPDVTAADWAACEDPDHYYVYESSLPSTAVATQCISFADDNDLDASAQPTKIRVVTPTVHVKTPFGAVAGVSEVPIGSSARAKLQPGANRSCGLCLIGAGESYVGNGDVTVEGASVHTNGSFTTRNEGKIEALPAGESLITAVNGCDGDCVPSATYAPTIADPYGSLVPSVGSVAAGLPVRTTDVDPCQSGPGVYTKDHQFDHSCTLPRGVYVVTGTWSLKNTTLLDGTSGVALYFACATGTTVRPCVAPGELGGELDVTNGDAQLSAMNTDPMQRFVVVYDKFDTSPLPLQGNGNTKYIGTVYAPTSQLLFPGNSTVTVENGPIIVGSLYSNGNHALLSLTSAVGADIPVPPEKPYLDQ